MLNVEWSFTNHSTFNIQHLTFHAILSHQFSLLFRNFCSSASRAEVSPPISPRRAAVRQNEGSRSVITSMEVALMRSFDGHVPRISSRSPGLSELTHTLPFGPYAALASTRRKRSPVR